MRAHLQAAPLAYFDQPAGVIKRHMDPLSGKWLNAGDRGATAALFRAK
jgi:hypothetical protein